MSGNARTEFASYIPEGDMATYASGLIAALKSNFSGEMNRLRDPIFQSLLVNYERRKREFLVAWDAQDIVTVEWRARGADGKEYKPDDYLTAFSQFVENNQDQIDAISILLRKPADWSYDALTDLREKLKTAPERFTQEQLRRAHEIKYDKALADIISMVKHAVSEDAPLYTPSERVDRAIARITADQQFTPEQQQWLSRIRDFMVTSDTLAIDEDDFETVPIFTSAGGWGRANRVFETELSRLLRKLNEALAV
jgi:type I restriction enzyme R subunit